MERYLDSCSESTPRCCFCEVELEEDNECRENNKELRVLQAKGLLLKASPQLRCPKCGLFFSKDNPWIYFSVDKFVKQYRNKHSSTLFKLKKALIGIYKRVFYCWWKKSCPCEHMNWNHCPNVKELGKGVIKYVKKS